MSQPTSLRLRAQEEPWDLGSAGKTQIKWPTGSRLNPDLQQCNVIIAIAWAHKAESQQGGHQPRRPWSHKHFLPLGDLGMEADTADREPQGGTPPPGWTLLLNFLSSISGTGFCSLSDCLTPFTPFSLYRKGGSFKVWIKKWIDSPTHLSITILLWGESFYF